MDENRITYFAETDARNKRVKFGIKAKDRTRHVYVIGKTGMGKSTLLENMAVQDIMNTEGMCFIDPHGKTADLLLEYVPEERVRDVIHIAPFDTDFPISFNVLESVDPTKRHLVVSGLMSTFKKIWVDAWSARMEYILTNTLLALLEAPGSTLLGVNRMLSDKDYRKEIVSHIQDPSVKAFWTKEFANYTERQAAEAVPAIQNKIGQFTANPLIRNMIGQPKSSFDFREAMDKRKIMIINLSKGKIGDENMKLLGGLLVTKIYLAAMSRADVPDRVMKMLPNFYLFVDEFQNFANASFADILSEARKYKLNLTIAHQYVEQMDEVVRPAVFGNVGTMIVFRIGATDAELLEKEFAPQFTTEDLVNLGFTQIYLKLMIDGLTSAPFSAITLPPIPHPDSTYVKEIIGASREQFARPRAQVEEEIIRFHEPVRAPVSTKPAGSALNGATQNSAPQSHSTTANHSPVTARPPTPSQPMPPVPSAITASSTVPRPVTSRPPEQTHKPFASLKQVITSAIHSHKESSAAAPAPASTPNPAPAPAPAPAPTSPAAPAAALGRAVPAKGEPQKPISLSSLGSKPAQMKVDPKVPTTKNVNDLKSALSAVLGKNAVSEPKGATVAPLAAQGTQPVPTQPAPSVPPVPPVPTAPVPPVPKKPEPAMPPAAPKEVPEEVLANILKDD